MHIHTRFVLNQPSFSEVIQDGPGPQNRTFGGQSEQVFIGQTTFLSPSQVLSIDGNSQHWLKSAEPPNGLNQCWYSNCDQLLCWISDAVNRQTPI